MRFRYFLNIILLINLLNCCESFSFTLTVTPTDETCSGNGSLAFSTTNNDPSGSMMYIIYKLPNATTPYATVSGNVLNGLTAGNYRVIGRETVGNSFTDQQQDVTINSAIVPLTYTIQSLNQACSTTSTITVITNTGTPVSYEIFSGPVLYPSQSSNVFSGLPVGVYKIRVFDNCGIGVVTTFTVTLNTTGLTIGQPSLSQTSPPDCTAIVVTNQVTSATGTVIGYPLDITYTINPPGGGASTTVHTTLNSGNAIQQDLVQTMTNYANQTFTYSISIVDACGSVHNDNFVVTNSINFSHTIHILDCNQNYFSLNASNYAPPYTVNFTSFPAGFNPIVYNANYPGPFNQNSIDFGDQTLITPFGNYSATITDACGSVKTTSFNIISNPPLPSATGTNNGCLTNAGTIVISIPSYKIVTATITSAPSSYPFSLPHDISSSIDTNGNITLNPVPLGDYTIQLTDNCNDALAPLQVTVPIYVDKGLASAVRNGCDLNTSAVKVSSKNGKLLTISITSAPASFGNSLPYNASFNIATDGNFYMNNLPAGTYVFNAVDECNFSNTISVICQGYSITSSTFSLQPHCGSFDIPLDFVSNGTANQTFWLQKLIDPVANTWGHPGTNVLYIAGSVPNSTNSLALINNGTNYNLTYNGTFRIVRSFLSYNNGSDFNSNVVSDVTKSCLEFLSPTLSFNQALEITDAYRLPCSPSGALDVVIEANGTAPLHYSIVQQNGASFILDNGSSNIFYNLPSAIYLFQVEDSCGNIVNRLFDVSTLASLINITQPNDLLDCEVLITGNETFDLTQQNALILGSQSPSNYTLTYYTNVLDAQNGVNAIGNLTAFNPATNPQTVVAKVIFNALPNCYEIRSFNLLVGQEPTLNLDANYLNCTTAPTIIDASSNNLPSTTYLWSNGATTPSITVGAIGVTHLTITATNSYNGAACTATKDITVVNSGLPVIDHVTTQDWTSDENSITVVVSSIGAFEYSLDNVHFQDENYFGNLAPGLYTVYVRDKAGCGMTTYQVWLLYYAKYFTPNGDGFHEYWRIENSELEPELKVVVYDRYGKFMASFDSNSAGWDGTYNGNVMVSDDYWFVVYRADGRIHRGHFCLKR